MVVHQPKNETQTHAHTRKTVFKRTFEIILNYQLVFLHKAMVSLTLFPS